jgi:hypothetical protein
VAFLGGKQREAFGQIETHLVAEYRKRAGTCPVGLAMAVHEDMPH